MQYASFWRRLTAYNIDLTVLIIPLFLLGFLIENDMIYYGICLVVVLLYHAALESSNWQATLGKRYHGLRVCDKNQKQLSFGKAFLRITLKFFSAGVGMFGYTMIAFNKQKQALHDYLLGTLVIVEERKKLK